MHAGRAMCWIGMTSSAIPIAGIPFLTIMIRLVVNRGDRRTPRRDNRVGNSHNLNVCTVILKVQDDGTVEVAARSQPPITGRDVCFRDRIVHRAVAFRLPCDPAHVSTDGCVVPPRVGRARRGWGPRRSRSPRSRMRRCCCPHSFPATSSSCRAFRHDAAPPARSLPLLPSTVLYRLTAYSPGEERAPRHAPYVAASRTSHRAAGLSMP